MREFHACLDAEAWYIPPAEATALPEPITAA
jgi:hypothetical protein